MAKKGENLLLKIGALEAKQGIEPNIERSKYIKVGNDDDLTSLRQEKILKHLYHLQKLQSKSFKKSKTFAIQKLVKKLKQLEDSGSKEEKDRADSLINLENKLKSLKEIKVEGNFLMSVFQDKWTSYIKEKCSFALIDNLHCGNDILKEVCQIKTFQTELEKNVLEFQIFLEKLFHEGEGNEIKNIRKRNKDNSKVKNRQPRSQNDPAMIYFNEGLSRTESGQGRKRKNRPGQRARKQNAERNFNDNAQKVSKRKDFDKEKSGKVFKNLDGASNTSIHPSWKAAKERTKVKFQGTKTVFSD